MMRKKMAVVLGSILVLGLGIGGYLYFRSEPVGEEGAVAEFQSVYLVKARTEIESSKSKETVMEVEGRLRAHTQGQEELVVEWEQINRLIGMGQAVDPSPLLHSRVLIHSDGLEAAYGFDPALAANFQEFQIQLLSRIFVPLTARTGGPYYLSEKEGNSLVRTQYEFKEQSEGARLKKSWIQVIQGTVWIDPERSTLNFEFEKDGLLKSVEGVLRFGTSGDEGEAVSWTTHINVNKQDILPLIAAKRVRLERSVFISASSSQTGSSTNGKEARSLADIFKAVDQYTGANTPEEHAELYWELAESLKDKPDGLQAFKSKILSNPAETGADQLQMNLLFSVLAGADTEESSKLLSEMIQTDCKNEVCTEKALNAYTYHSNPSLESAQELLDVAVGSKEEWVSSSAFLAAGAASRILGDRFEGLRPAITTALREAEASGNMDRKNLMLRAIGNSGDRGLLPLLNENLNSEEISSQNYAFFALRFMPGQDVNQTLVQALDTGAAETSGNEILRSAGYRQFSAEEYAQLAERATRYSPNDKDLVVRTIEILSDAYVNEPEKAKSALELLSSQLKDPELTELVNQGLNPLGAIPAYKEDRMEGLDTAAPEENE